MAVDVVGIIFKVEQLRAFLSDTDKAAKGVKGVGSAAEKSGKQAGLSWKSIAKWGGAATAAYAAQRFLSGAVDTTEELAKSSLALNRTTGMNIQTSAEWAAVLKTRGVSTQQFQRATVMLSKQMTTANDASTAAGKKAEAMFIRLGVSMRDLHKGNTQAVLAEVADGLQKIRNPAERAALAQKLFGRAAITLAPLLTKGRKAMEENLKTAGKYIDFRGKDAKSVAEEIKKQRELKLAFMGLQVSLAKVLLPALGAVTDMIQKLTDFLAPLIKHGWLLKAAVVAVTAAFVAWKVVLFATNTQLAAIKIATLAYKAAQVVALVAMRAYTAAQWLLNAAMDANPIGAVIVALTALVTGIVIAYKKVKWFRDGINWLWQAFKDTWTWIKDHWPLLVGILTGGFGTAVALIVTHWKDIKNAAKDVIYWIVGAWRRMKDALIGAFQMVGHWVMVALGPIIDTIKWIIDKINAIKGGSGLAQIQKNLDKQYGRGGSAPSSAVANAFPGGQHGGTLTRGGSILVGEAGPEIVTLPQMARITPLPAGMPAPWTSGALEISVPVFLDRRQIAEAVGRFTADKLARR